MRLPSDAARRALVAAALAALALPGCHPPQPLLEVTPTTRTVDLERDRSTTFAVMNGGAAGSRLRWRFESDTLEAMPPRGTIEAGDARVVVVEVRPGSTGSTFFGTFVADEQAVTVTVRATDGMICDPASAYLDASAHHDGEILVAYRPDATRAAAVRSAAGAPSVALAESVGGRLLREGIGREHDLLLVPVERVAEVLDALRARPDVVYAVPNGPVYRAAAPDDPLYERQWNLNLFGAEPAWALIDALPAQADVVVAVVDDGVAVGHPDLATVALPGWDVRDNDADVRNCTDHGTHVAGIATAARNDAIGVAGVASTPWVRLLPVKAWPDTVDDRASTTIDAILRGMRWAAGLPVAGLPPNPHPADVVNLSLGTPDGTMETAFTTVIAELEAAGVVVVSAAGNAGTGSGVEYPARAGGIAVGSVNADYGRSVFSTYGTGLTLMAPGGTGPGSVAGCNAITSSGVLYSAGIAAHAWTCKAGTSMATPYVSGAVALLIGLDPSLRRAPELVAQRLEDAAALLRPAGYDPDQYGAGVLCLDALLGAASVCGAPAP